MFKKQFALVLAASLAAGSLMACGGGAEEKAAVSVQPESAESGDETAADGEAKVFPAGTLTVYAMGNPQYRQQYFETWLDSHRDIAPEVEIEFVQTEGTADIREKITMTALSGATEDLPDAAMLDPVIIMDLAKAGLLQDETEYLEPLVD